METISIKFNRADIDRLMSAINTASCALHNHLDFSTEDKARETERSPWGREWRELGNLFSTLYEARQKLDNERKEWEEFRAERKARGERWLADC